MKRIALFIVTLCLVFFLLPGYAKADESFPTLNSTSVVLMDAKTRRVLYEINPNEKRYPASTTKIMTMLLAVENGNLDDTLTLSHEAIFSIERDSSHIALDENEIISLRSAVEACSMASANDAANGIAEFIGGSFSGFADMMNARAAELGCTNTHFVNAHGLYDPDHYTTAYDMALIMAAAAANPTYLELTTITSDTIAPTNIQPETRPLNTNNRLLIASSPYYIEEVVTSKSGYTDESKHSLVSYAKKGDVELIVSIIGSETAADCYNDTRSLLDYAFANYQLSPNSDELVELPSLPVAFYLHADNPNELALESPFSQFVIPNDQQEALSISYELPDTLSQSKKSGSVVGTATLYLGNEVLETRNIILTENVSSKFSLFINFIFTTLKWIIILLVSAIIALIVAKKIYIHHRRKKRRQQRRHQSR